jgi:hypothetical protein
MVPKCASFSQLVPSGELRVCPPFLVRDLRRFCSGRVSIVFFGVMIFLVSFSGCFLLGILLCRHRELFIGWDHGGRQCWGSENQGIPEHKIPERTRESMQKWGDKESSKVCTHLKSCEPLYTCPWVPFHREAKGLLHSDITLESREYPKCEHVHECLLHPVIHRANFIYLQASH